MTPARCRRDTIHAAGRDFLDFMNELVAARPGKQMHVVLDNLNTHKPKRDRWLKAHPYVHLHFTPTYSSWLNQIECWFSILSRSRFRGTIFTSPAIRVGIEVIDDKAIVATPSDGDGDHHPAGPKWLYSIYVGAWYADTPEAAGDGDSSGRGRRIGRKISTGRDDGAGKQSHTLVSPAALSWQWPIYSFPARSRSIAVSTNSSAFGALPRH